MNTLDHLHIEGYDTNGIFKGYAKRVSKRDNKVEFTMKKT